MPGRPAARRDELGASGGEEVETCRDVSRVVVDGVEVDIKRVANEFVRDDGQPVQLELGFREEQTAQRKANARRSHGAPLTFHVHALDTHRAAEIADKWLAKPLSQALIGSFLDQVRA